MLLHQKFIAYINRENLFNKGDKLLLAVSGGIDSIVLAHLLKNAGYQFSIAHCNFKLRPLEVEQESQLVQQLATDLKVDFYSKEFETSDYALSNKISIQVAARNLRYHWFEELLVETGSRYLLTGHHADDNIETALMNFFKGTGISGLRGIMPKHQSIIRPLLFARKNQLEDYAKQFDLRYSNDSSNLSDKYSRNYFRHQVIPMVQNIYPAAEENLLNNIERFRETEELYQQAIDLNKKKLLEHRNNEVYIPVLKLAKLKAATSVLFESIKEYGFTTGQLSDVLALIKTETGKYVESNTHTILKNRNWLIISEKNADDAAIHVVEHVDQDIIYSGKKLRSKIFNAIDYTVSKSPDLMQVDADLIRFPLLLRKWKQGDYFYPLGMQKKKKLSRFFIDIKLSKIDKEKIYVLEMDKKIISIVGLRIDDRFKIKSSTNSVLKIWTENI